MKKARILNGHHQAAGEQRHDSLLVFREVIQVAALNVQDADAFSAKEKRHGELGLHTFDGVDVPGILGSVADTNGLAR